MDEIYDAVARELEAMHKILETSRKPRRSLRLNRVWEEKETDLTKWFG